MRRRWLFDSPEAEQTELRKLAPVAASLASHEPWRQLVNAPRKVELPQIQLMSLRVRGQLRPSQWAGKHQHDNSERGLTDRNSPCSRLRS